MRLSPHFMLAELTRSSTAMRLDIGNRPGEEEIQNLRYLAANVLEPIREEWGPFSPTSGYRCPKLNAAIGSRPTSQHTRGEAADIDLPGVPPIVLAQWCRENLDEWDQLILEFGAWTHISLTDGLNRNETFSITREGIKGGLVE